MSMNNSINSESQKDQAQLEREIDAQRAHLGETISALEAQFSPGQMLDKMLSYTKANGGEFSQNLVNTVKNNPVPTIMTLMGVAWMMYGQNHPPVQSAHGAPSNASYGLDPAYDHHNGVKEKAGQWKNNVKGGMSNARHRVSETSAHWRDSAHHASDELRMRAGQASDGFNRLLREQPLAVGAIGLAVGALIAASLPTTRTEDRYMGETRDRIADKTRDAVQKGKKEVNAFGKQVADSVKHSDKENSSPAAGPYTAQSSYQNDSSPKLNS